MQIGPFQFEHWHLALIGAGVLSLLWFLWGFLVPVTGTWERVDEDVRPGNVERITLVQFGPFIRGRRMMKGGFQEYSGLIRGRGVALVRRDHGREMIMNQGFPEPISHAIDGTVTARLRLTLSADNQIIHGTFTPQKIEFTYEPPRVTSRRFLQPQFRRYRLVSRQPVESEIVEDQSRSPSDPSGQERLRRTV